MLRKIQDECRMRRNEKIDTLSCKGILTPATSLARLQAHFSYETFRHIMVDAANKWS